MNQLVEIPGQPRPKQRPRKGRDGQWYNPSADEERRVAYYFLRHKGLFPEGDLQVDLEFRCTSRSRADVDNLMKLVLDAMQMAGVFTNDHQVKVARCVKMMVSTGEEQTTVRFGRELSFA